MLIDSWGLGAAPFALGLAAVDAPVVDAPVGFCNEDADGPRLVLLGLRERVQEAVGVLRVLDGGERAGGAVRRLNVPHVGQQVVFFDAAYERVARRVVRHVRAAQLVVEHVVHLAAPERVRGDLPDARPVPLARVVRLGVARFQLREVVHVARRHPQELRRVRHTETKYTHMLFIILCVTCNFALKLCVEKIADAFVFLS